MAAERNRILVVDDNREVTGVLKRYLEHSGFIVSEAYDGYGALQSLYQTPPDLVLLDLSLPDQSGLSLTRTIRRDPLLAATPIIVITANPSDALRSLALEKGVNDYVLKPFDPQALLERVRRHLDAPAVRGTDEVVVAISLENPEWGCGRISEALQAQGMTLSSPTVQKILIRHGIGRASERAERLEKAHLLDAMPLSQAQMAFLESANPCFRDRGHTGKAPGDILGFAILPAELPRRYGRQYLHVFVDTCSSFAFATLHRQRHSGVGMTLFTRVVRPFFDLHGLRLSSIITDSSSMFSVTEQQGIRQRLIMPDGLREWPSLHGAIERFVTTYHEEHGTLPVDESQPQNVVGSLDQWLLYYNYERHQPGFPNFGARPFDRVTEAL